ncbi:DUF3862 domain-containing protein [Thalassotalea fusca]
MKLSSSLLAISLVILLSACSKVNKENYDKLELGMSKEEIQAVIGGADNCEEAMGTLTCVWGDKDAKHIKVRFVADAAVTFSNSGL